MVPGDTIHYKKSLTKAQQYCNNFNYGGYTSWRLPTINELKAIYKNRKKFISFMRDQNFWSSTQSKWKERVQTITYSGDLATHRKDGWERTICVKDSK